MSGIAILHSHLHAAERGNHGDARAGGRSSWGARSVIFAPTRSSGYRHRRGHETSFAEAPRYRPATSLRPPREHSHRPRPATPSPESGTTLSAGVCASRCSCVVTAVARGRSSTSTIFPDKRPHWSPSLERAMKQSLDADGRSCCPQPSRLLDVSALPVVRARRALQVL